MINDATILRVYNKIKSKEEVEKVAIEDATTHIMHIHLAKTDVLDPIIELGTRFFNNKFDFILLR